METFTLSNVATSGITALYSVAAVVALLDVLCYVGSYYNHTAPFMYSFNRKYVADF